MLESLLEGGLGRILSAYDCRGYSSNFIRHEKQTNQWPATLLKRCSCFFVIAIVLPYFPALALTLEELDSRVTWHVRTLSISGNQHFSTSELRAEVLTKTRPWYTLWRPLPEFDPGTFAKDVQRLQRFYQAGGYYHAQITYDLEVEADTVTPRITISEGPPVSVAQISLELTDLPELQSSMSMLRSTLPLQPGDIFREERYQQAEAQIKEYFLQLHRGRVTVSRSAQVDVDKQTANVSYTITAGPLTVFGPTTVEGTTAVDPSLVTRELTYQPGMPFSAHVIEQSRKKILALNLFSAVRFLQVESPLDPTVVPMRVQVEEKPAREWKLGVGYGTEDELRGQVHWQHNNWFGDGRQLNLQVKASSLTRLIELSFVQPYVFGSRNRFSLIFRPQQVDEPSYLLNLTRLQFRLDREFSETLSGFLAYRVEYDKLSNVKPTTIRELRDFVRKGVLSGLGLGLLLNTSDDRFDPTRGSIVSLSAEQIGGILGGDFDFYKLQGEVKHYHLLMKQTVLATRLRLGFANPVAGGKEVPLFERFFSGGAASVRGYGRYRLGPLSAADDPIGGRSLIEGSLELRRPLFENLSGALFLDFGQVARRSFVVPIDNLRFAAGFGISYKTAVGPLRLDLGFPFDPPHGDQPWQVHFSIGQFF